MLESCDWYIAETVAKEPDIASRVQFGPFTSEQECCAILPSIRQIPRFSGSELAIFRKCRRREKRFRLELLVKVRRQSAEAQWEPARTLDISNAGARLADLPTPLHLGEIVEVNYGRRKAPFRVAWVGSDETAGHVGIECLAPELNLWDLDLGEETDDSPFLREIVRARAVQNKMLPQEAPALDTLDYYADCIQARLVGGDYYDYFRLDETKLALVMADVSGKGVPAALLMANLQASLRGNAAVGKSDLPEWLRLVNRHFHQHTEQERYATLFLACYNDHSRQLQYVNCGHNAPVLLRASGDPERLPSTGTVLGLFSDWDCTVGDTSLYPGDLLCSFTDGVTEAAKADGTQFGEQRLLEVLQQDRNADAVSVLHHVQEAVEDFREGDPQDDMTILVARAR